MLLKREFLLMTEKAAISPMLMLLMNCADHRLMMHYIQTVAGFVELKMCILNEYQLRCRQMHNDSSLIMLTVDSGQV